MTCRTLRKISLPFLFRFGVGAFGLFILLLAAGGAAAQPCSICDEIVYRLADPSGDVRLRPYPVEAVEPSGAPVEPGQRLLPVMDPMFLPDGSVWIYVQAGDEAGWIAESLLAYAEAEPEAAAQQPPSRFYVHAPGHEGLNLRSGPGARNSKVILMPNGSDVRMIGGRRRVGNSIWVELESGGQRGWANSRYLAERPAKPESGESESVALGPVAFSVQRVMGVTNVEPGGWLNMRAGPGADHIVIARVPSGARDIHALGHEKDNWIYAEWSGVWGWFSADFLEELQP